MRARRPLGRLALALVASLAMAPTCTPEVGSVAVLPLPSAVLVGQGQVFTLDVQTRLQAHELQAFDLEVSFDPALLAFEGAFPGSGFDDDGTLFLPAAAQAGTIAPLVDLRHGPDPASGNPIVLSLSFRALAPGITQVAVSSAALADPSGTILTVEPLAAQVTILP